MSMSLLISHLALVSDFKELILSPDSLDDISIVHEVLPIPREHIVIPGSDDYLGVV